MARIRLCKESARRSPAATAEAVILLCAAVLWTWSGASTWHDLIGHPRDAPFLMIPGHIRAIFFWWIPATFALVCAWRRQATPLAYFALSIGSVVRLLSYLISWITSWPAVDGLIPDSELKGDPHAWGSAWIYASIVIGLGGFDYLCHMMRRYEDSLSAARIQLATSTSNHRSE